MTKKGRTLMTAFAGSIGIIGIAAILALANGVNDYIARVEEDALLKLPPHHHQAEHGHVEPALRARLHRGGLARRTARRSRATRGRDASSTDQTIPEYMMLTDMFASVGTNDLSGLKDYLESGDARASTGT